MSLKWSRYPPEVLPAWVAEMDFPVAPAITAAVREAVERGLFGYSTDAAKADLAEACAQWLWDAHGWRASQVHVLPDVLKGVELGIALHSPEGSPVVVPTPAYPPLFDVVRQCRRPVVEVPMDLGRIEGALAAGARTVVLCNPNNPLGTVAAADDLKALSHLVDRYGARVVADEVHAPIVYPGHRHVPYAAVSDEAAAHTVTVVSASKGWNLAGLKCAQAIVSPADEPVWAALPTLRTWGASSLGIIANTAAYRSGRDWLAGVVAELDVNRRYLASRLGEFLPRTPEGTYLAWLDFRGLPEDPARFFLREAKVALSSGAPYRAPGFARLNFATDAGVLARITDRMLEAL